MKYTDLPPEIQGEFLVNLTAYQMICQRLAPLMGQSETEIAQGILLDAYQVVQSMTPEFRTEILSTVQRTKDSMRELGRPAIVASVQVNKDVQVIGLNQQESAAVVGAHVFALRIAAEQIANLSAIDGTVEELYCKLVRMGADWLRRSSPEDVLAMTRWIPDYENGESY